MNTKEIHINFAFIALAFSKYVREKATISGSKIVYIKDNNLIEEDPSTLEITVLKPNVYSLK